jgi:DNA-binding transcriptional ArsR family regulator
MPDFISENSSNQPSQEISRGSGPKKSVYRDNQAIAAREALYRAVREINSKNKKRYNQIQKLRFLVFELQSLQPVDVNELSEALGQSQATTREQLKKLRKLDLVTRTRFEHHTLYCTNGDFNQYIEDILESFYWGNQAA